MQARAPHHKALDGLVLGHEHAGRLAAHLRAHTATSATLPLPVIHGLHSSPGQAVALARRTPRSAPTRAHCHVSRFVADEPRCCQIASAWVWQHACQIGAWAPVQRMAACLHAFHCKDTGPCQPCSLQASCMPLTESGSCPQFPSMRRH